MSNEHCPICYDSFTLSSTTKSAGEDDDQHDLEAQEKNSIETTTLQDPKERLTIQGCRHDFCRECLVSHCKHAISVKAIPITCPAASVQHACETLLEDDFIKDLLLQRDSANSVLGEESLPLEEAPLQPRPLSPQQAPLSSSDSADAEQASQPLLASLADATTNTTSTLAVTVVGKDGVRSAPSSPDWVKFQRFQRMLHDPSLVTCTKCQELVAPPPVDEPNNNTLSPESNPPQQQPPHEQQRYPNQLTCPSCHHTFCRIHGDAHPPHLSCDDYDKSHEARQVKKSEKAIRRYTKPCSHCEAPIEKESGCDHIVCGSCHQDMCFKCGTHLYLSGDMIRSCEQCQQNFVDHRHIWAYRITLCLSLPCYIPFGILHILVMGLLAIATCGCCCCFGCGTQIKPKGGTTTTTTTTSTGTSNTENNTNTTNNNEASKREFQPLVGIRLVLGLIFLPVVDLARQCGFRCCCELDRLSAATSNTFRDDDDDDDDDDGNGYNNHRTDASVAEVSV
jgi:hypothetical protein